MKDDDPTRIWKRRKQMARRGLHTNIDKDDSEGAKGLTSPEQTATGKGISNPLMAVMVCQKPYGLTTPELMANCLKALDEGYSSKNYVRKFLRALHPKWREKVKAIKESKDLTSLSLEELIRNLKVQAVIIRKDRKIVKAKGERRSLALKAKKESSDEECSTSGSEDEEYATTVRDFKKFFKRKECLKPPRDKNQRAFIGGSWSDSDEEDDKKIQDETCLTAQAPNEICLGVDLEPDEWIKDCGCSKHMMGRLGHANMHLIQSLASKELVRNLPKLKFDQHIYDACKIGKQALRYHKANNIVSRLNAFELRHQFIFSGHPPWSYGGNRYTLVIVDDYSRYTWTRFLKDETEAFDQFEIFSKKIQNQLGCTIVSIRTDHGREFDNEVQFGEFCNANGYSQNSKGYIILNKHTRKIKESLNVTFDETPPPSKTSPLVDDDLDEEEAIRAAEKKNLENVVKDETLEIDEIVNTKEYRNHPLENVIGNLNQRTLRNKLDENGVVSRNKAMLVAQGYKQQEGIDYDETYAHVARL
ncbi:retrovirus-related pol polyprotein from transposon TNT 1-94 [Tanacetum coccineum]